MRVDGLPPETCGGCEGLGAHSPRCLTQPGSYWKRMADMADQLGDMIGANDMHAANSAYSIAARMTIKWNEYRR